MVVSPATVSMTWQGALGRAADEHALDAAVLVAERDLQVEDLLAVALKAEVPRLDDPGVDRADRHLVDLLALDPVEVHHADDRLHRPPAGPRRRGPARYEAWKRTGLNQGCPSGTTPNCSAISRSKRWTWGQLGVSEGNRSSLDPAAADAQERPSASSASTA